MKIINTIFITLCCYFLHLQTYAQEQPSDGRFVDFRQIYEEPNNESVTASWMISASPKLSENMDSVYFLLSTGNTQVKSRIQFLPEFRDLFADHEIELDGLFDLLYRVDGGGVVLTA